jgi:CRP-like cAMP-binding protein
MRILDANLDVKLKALRKNSYFDDLSEERLKEIAAQTQLRGFERGEVLFWEDDPCAGLHIIEEGSVKLYRISPQGRQYIIRVLQEGDTCNEVPAFDGGSNPVNVETLERSKVWVIDADLLRALVRAHPDFALKVLSNFGKNLRGLVRMVSEMAFYQVTNRLARLIRELPAEEPRAPDPGATCSTVGDGPGSCRAFVEGTGTKRRDPHRRPSDPYCGRYGFATMGTAQLSKSGCSSTSAF